MLNVYLAQINTTYGKNAFLPYSVGLLQAYALTIPTIKENYNFGGFVFLREEPEKVVARWKNPSVVGISVYIWNATISLAIAKAVKKANPKCLMVIGGPHAPNKSEEFLQEHPYIDIVAHHEGEITFSNILLERLKEKPDYTTVPGISLKSGKTLPAPRISDLDALPSPYLTGIFDELMKEPYDMHASQETNRGCPYACTFCEWGDAVFTKVRKFGDERIINELKWFAENKIDLLYNCDSNFGIFERDANIAQEMANLKKQYDFPNKFRAAYAKNSNDRVYQIAKILNDANMNKGVTLSFQSMDDNTLEIIKRKNIKVQDFQGLMQKYRKEKIPTYSEIIIGLPGETYNTFANGMETLLNCGQHDSINCYTCEVLPNAELNEPTYREKYKIQSVKTPVLFFHGTPYHDKYQEHYELIISTSSLPVEDWLKCQRIAWAVQCFHCLSLTQCIAVFLHYEGKMSYRSFYEKLLAFANEHPKTITGEVTSSITQLFHNIIEGKEWGIIDQRFGNIVWPPEEGGFLKIMVNKDNFYEEIKHLFDVPEDVITYQKAILVNPYQDTKVINLNYNLHEYLEAAYLNEPIPLENKSTSYKVNDARNYNGDLEKYAREVVWYNRKKGDFKYTNIEKIN